MFSGDIRLSIRERTSLRAYVATEEQWLFEAMEDGYEVTLPPGASLKVPTASAVPNRDGRPSWTTADLIVNEVQAGDVASAHTFIIHVVRSLGPGVYWPRRPVTGGTQNQISFSLPGWDLTIEADTDGRPSGFAHIIEATPTRRPVTAEDVEHLGYRLFILLSFLRGSEIGIGPIVGLGADSGIVWARWTPPRAKQTGGRHRWCWPGLVPVALPALASGMSTLAAERGLEIAVLRATELLLTANDASGGLPLDVRIPVVASGLELMAWSVLQHCGWLTSHTANSRQLQARARLRLLLKWAGVPTELPHGFSALRRRALEQREPEGPELVFWLRNRLVHPPKSATDPDWPKGDEMIEGLTLALWYLELSILRVLGYQGEYVSRLVQRGWEGDTTKVPWTV